MNSNNKAASKTANKAAGAVALVAGSVASVGSAMATVDTTAIITNITDYAAAGVVVVLAFLAARWGIHALGLLRPKG